MHRRGVPIAEIHAWIRVLFAARVTMLRKVETKVEEWTVKMGVVHVNVRVTLCMVRKSKAFA